MFNAFLDVEFKFVWFTYSEEEADKEKLSSLQNQLCVLLVQVFPASTGKRERAPSAKIHKLFQKLVFCPWKEPLRSVTCIKCTSCCPEEHCSLLKSCALHLSELNVKIITSKKKKRFLDCFYGLCAVLFRC